MSPRTPMHDDRVSRLLDDLGERLQDGETRSKLKTVLRACGYRNRTERRMHALEQALVQADIFARPRLTDPEVNLEEFIEFSRNPYLTFQPDLLFPDESGLKTFLLRNYRHIDVLRGLKAAKAEHPLPSGAKIDILFRERGTDDYVVCELKTGDGAYEVGGQIFSYMAELEHRAVAEGVGVRGIIVTGTPNLRVEAQVRAQAESTGLRVDWYCYEASLKLHPLVTSATTLTTPRSGAGGAASAA